MNELQDINIASTQQKLAKIKEFQNLVRSQFTEHLDYGIIPGSKKLSMLKPGAEKILMLLGLTSKFEVEQKVQDYENGFISYSFICRLYSNDLEITQGFGTCNTKESKYEKANPYSVENTVMKMAKKRALVDAALLVGSLSDIFTQDIEEMDDLDGNRARDYKPQATDASGTITQKQAKRLFAIANGDGELVKEIMIKHGYGEDDRSTSIQKLDYEKIVAEVEQKVKENSEKEEAK